MERQPRKIMSKTLSAAQCVHGFTVSELVDCQGRELGAGGWLGVLLQERLGVGSLLRPVFSKLW